jgi:glycerophosphoryl diester phosphodiesterase
MLNRRFSLATIFAVLIGLFAASGAQAIDRPATPPPTDFWQNKNFMNMAHQGGETEAPGNTLFAFKTAIEDRGADTLEMDGYVTEDGHFVITHDLDPYKTSDAPGTDDPSVRVENQINNLTLAELKEFDFAYKFRPNGDGHYDYDPEAPAEEYIYRGIATGDKPAPEGYDANDFRIPTLQEVLEAFPDTPLNVDMKAPYSNQQMAIDAAETVAEIMKEYPERSEDVIIASFFAPAVTAFHEEYPGHKALTAGEGELEDYAFSGAEDPIEPTPVALQPPDRRTVTGIGTLEVVPLIKAGADYDGYAIHVWPSGSPDSPETWQKVIDQGADSFFTDRPSQLHEYLCETGVPRPDGSLRCPQQQCPEGQEGYAPNCQPIPCPAGTEGVSPNCQPVQPVCPAMIKYGKGDCEIDKTARVTKLSFAKKRGKVKAGKKVKLKLKIRNSVGVGSKATIRLKSSNRRVKLPKKVTVFLKYSGSPATTTRTITVRANRKARGKAKITATAQGKKGTANLKVKQARKKAKKNRR